MAVADKIPLQRFVETVAGEWLSAVEAVEQQHPGWEVGASEIVARVAFVLEKKPGGGESVLLLDLDEPSRLLSELRIPIRRKA